MEAQRQQAMRNLENTICAQVAPMPAPRPYTRKAFEAMVVCEENGIDLNMERRRLVATIQILAMRRGWPTELDC